MKIANTGGFGSVPKIEIVDKKVIYRSEIHFTPLLNENEIDAIEVKNIIENEYIKANIKADEIDTGAVIITGETVKKSNSAVVANALSELAGDFVVASAGADLESVLSGKGAGADKISSETNKIIANFDIGGGTTNISVFKDGISVDTACLDLGGRLIKLNENREIIYISKKLQKLLALSKIEVFVGLTLDSLLAEQICLEMANVISSICEADLYDLQKVAVCEKLQIKREKLELMITNHGLSGEFLPQIVTFSGGVADCIFGEFEDEFVFDDIGVFLGRRLGKNERLMSKCQSRASETIRATVIGAGNFSMDVSGSTIEFDGCDLPLKSVPVSRINLCNDEDISSLETQIKSVFERADSDKLALSMLGLACPSFLQIESIADGIYRGAIKQIEEGKILIIAVEADIGKALGQALKRRIKGKCSLVCIDQISCGNGDFIDIAKPVYQGKVLPVIVKTLIFN